jgi:ribulose-phosphate 3-epimerase
VTIHAIRLAASVLAADFSRLGDQVAEAAHAGVDRIHVDVMDGHFVPNISMGTPVISSLRRATRLPLEAHLMISNPDCFVDEFARAGIDSFLIHWEGNNDLSRTVHRVKAAGKRVGVAINPATSATVVEEVIEDLDQVLVMTVNPGFGHQRFLYTTLHKIRRTREIIDQLNPDCALEVDGGINTTTAPLAVAAGASVLVAGSAIFNDGDGIAAAVQRLRVASAPGAADPRHVHQSSPRIDKE